MRARLLKPGFFDDTELSKLPLGAHFLFSGLWCLADREGRLRDIPKRIAADVFPHRDDIGVPMVNQWLTNLASKNFLVRYEANGERFIQIRNFAKHQKVNPHESASEIPQLIDSGLDSALVNHWSTNGVPMQREAEAEAEAEAYPSITTPQAARVRPIKPAKPNADREAWFLEWYAFYPRHEARADALKAFCRHVTNRAICDQAIAATKAKRGGLDNEAKYLPYPATWLNRKPWEDEDPAPRNGRAIPTFDELHAKGLV